MVKLKYLCLMAKKQQLKMDSTVWPEYKLIGLH